jgi:hypothetical protein
MLTVFSDGVSEKPMVWVRAFHKRLADGPVFQTTMCDHGVPLGMDALRSVGCVRCAREVVLFSRTVPEVAGEWQRQLLLESEGL